MDEATSSLDPVSEAEVIKTVRQLVEQQGLSVLSITHRLATAESADQVLVMDRGRIVESGSPEEVLKEEGATKLSTAPNLAILPSLPRITALPYHSPGLHSDKA